MAFNSNLTQSQERAVSYDAGLRNYFQRIYNIMAFGLVVTGTVAFGVSHSQATMEMFFGNAAIRFLVIFAPLLMVWFGFSQARFATLNSQQLTMMFVAYAAMLGVSLSILFLVYGNASIARAFFITGGTFAGTSVYGYTTKKDLTNVGSMCFMGFVGIFAASVVGYFFKSSALELAVSVISVPVFVGLIVWKTQQLKQMYRAGNSAEINNKLAIWGALQLYVSFINLFMAVLRLSGNRR